MPEFNFEPCSLNIRSKRRKMVQVRWRVLKKSMYRLRGRKTRDRDIKIYVRRFFYLKPWFAHKVSEN